MPIAAAPEVPVSAEHGSRPRDRRGRELPTIIQGGMGVAVSSWQLAREVARAGQLGVVSGTALDVVIARRLQDGDSTGDIRRALAAFPVPALAAQVLESYFQPEGRAPGASYKPVPKPSLRATPENQRLSVVANFVEVWLAKEGHDGLIGVNFLEKLQMATPAAAYGAVLAGVDYVLMGAGIPAEIPRLLDSLARHEPAALSVDVVGATDEHLATLDPAAVLGTTLAPLPRPDFLAIVSAHVLAAYLAREDATRPDGFVVEGPTAGGHNAPPRGRPTFDEVGQPVFGPRDLADLPKVAAVGLPYWLAGGYGTPERVREAVALGAAGVQVGTLFALARESGLPESMRTELLTQLASSTLEVRTSALASPTGFPFKVTQVAGTVSDEAVYAARPRLCDLGYLRRPYVAGDRIGYRCSAEPADVYVAKGGAPEDTEGRSCLCNGLTATIGLPQTRRDGYTEQPIVTLGQDLEGPARLLAQRGPGWSGAQAVEFLVG